MKVTGRRLDQLEQKCLQNYLSILCLQANANSSLQKLISLEQSLILSADSGFLTLCQLPAQSSPYCPMKCWPSGMYSQPRIHLHE